MCSVRCGDGFFGWPEEAPFDAIILTCAPGQIPQPLIDQLREGGRIIAPVGGVLQVQELLLGTKKQGKLSMQTLAPVRFVPMRGQAEKNLNNSTNLTCRIPASLRLCAAGKLSSEHTSSAVSGRISKGCITVRTRDSPRLLFHLSPICKTPRGDLSEHVFAQTLPLQLIRGPAARPCCSENASSGMRENLKRVIDALWVTCYDW